jgi:hypothetical protein
MRRLMVKLVAIETALVGWLAYWIFLVYSNNPEVSAGLASQLSKFPQLSFTTVDITVLVVISALSILLAFKFDRGLKPGIRLERAIQMLESLMKRNLMLEAQVAEMKMASVQATTLLEESKDEAPLGSWERAFRTPIEAGPSTRSRVFHKAGRGTSQDSRDNAPESTTPQRSYPVRSDSKPSQMPSIASSNKAGPEPLFQTDGGQDGGVVSASKSELAPDQFSAWTGATPSLPINQAPPVTPATPRKSNVAIAQPNSRRQPYIPVPATKTVLPPSLPTPSVSPSRSRPVARSNQTTGIPVGSQSIERKASAPKPVDSSSDPSSPTDSSSSEITRSIPSDNSERDEGERISGDDDSQTVSKTTNKASGSPKKRFPWEDE